MREGGGFALREESALKRVLYVIATLDPAGAERQMVHLCRRLPRGDFEPAVCCLTRSGPLEEDLRRDGIPVQVLHKSGRWDLRVVARLVAAMRRRPPDIVHTWLPTANTLGRVAAISARVPVLIASERAADVWKGFARRAADRALTHYTARVLTNAEAVRRFLVDRVGLPEGKIQVIRNGFDATEFDAAAARGPQAPLPERGDALVVGAVGRLEPQKGTTYLIAAAALLRRMLDRPFQVWVVGGGPDENALRRQAEEAGVADCVRFLGLRLDVPAVMGQFDLFALPSLWEGLPNVALEAMAARRAVVATDVNGTPEAVADGRTGLLVPPRDPEALARALAELLRDADRRKAFGEAGRTRVETEFGMQRMVDLTVQAYRETLAGAKP